MNKSEMLLTLLVYLCMLAAVRGIFAANIVTKERDHEFCMIELNGNTTQIETGQTLFSNDSCITYTCMINELGIPQIRKVKKECKNECLKGYELQTVPGKCCGVCVKTKCFYLDRMYNVGDTWHDEDHCMLFECAMDNGAPVIVTFKKTCPPLPSCLAQDVYTKDCCQYCREGRTLQPDDLTSELSDKILDKYENHPCKRECVNGGPSMVCQYKFRVEWYETLSKACYDCPYNQTHCDRLHCITGDGVRRSVLVVNRNMPGPAIEVCLNDVIVVDVTNELLGDSTTIHWHGLHQKQSPYMDGVPNLTQCPIIPHVSFQYKFIADNPGTHFWHSHVGLQRGDGCYGALIIRKPNDPHLKLYDYDLTEHIIINQDWIHTNGLSMFTSHHHSVGDNKPVNILVNGKGRLLNNKTEMINPVEGDSLDAEMEATTYSTNVNSTENPISNLIEFSVSQSDNTTNDVPYEIFSVTKGFRYRFRTINAGFLNCPIVISVDNHSLLVIQSDGYDLEPIEVKSFVTYAGERFDFILNANQPVGNYWMRFKGIMDCDERFQKVHQVAIVRYQGASNTEPSASTDYNFPVEGIQLNPLNKGPGHVDSMTIAETKSLDEDDDWLSQTEADMKFYIFYDFYSADHSMFFHPPAYGFKNISKPLYSPQLNHISMKTPPFALLPSRDLIDDSTFCNETSLQSQGINCEKDFCECPHVLKVPLNAVVELVLVDEGHTFNANHPFHLHGFAFRVIGMDRIGNEVTIDQIKKLDKHGQLHRNLKRPPIKDTVTVPDGGYSIIRFKADNPGYWLFHCHIEFHAEIGMALVFKVGEHSDMLPVPDEFPKCSSYMPSPKRSSASMFSYSMYMLYFSALDLLFVI